MGREGSIIHEHGRLGGLGQGATGTKGSLLTAIERLTISMTKEASWMAVAFVRRFYKPGRLKARAVVIDLALCHVFQVPLSSAAGAVLWLAWGNPLALLLCQRRREESNNGLLDMGKLHTHPVIWNVYRRHPPTTAVALLGIT